MSFWSLLGIAGALTVVISAAWTQHRTRSTALSYPPLGSATSTFFNLSLGLAAAGLAAGSAWALVALVEGGSPTHALDLIVCAAALRQVVFVWRTRQARVVDRETPGA